MREGGNSHLAVLAVEAEVAKGDPGADLAGGGLGDGSGKGRSHDE